MSSDVGRYWDTWHAGDSPADSLLAHPLVQGYLSLRAFGSTRGHVAVAIEEIERRTEPGSRVLSVGCGGAGKEKAICRALPDRVLVGLDIASDTLARMRDEIARDGPHNLELLQGDFNALELEPQSYDMVLGLGALHHIETLENFWAQCRLGLRPKGAVLAQEYVGPTRFQWTEAQMEYGNDALLRLVPPEHRGGRTAVERVPAEKIAAIDPSEAVRSAEILSTCRDSGLTVETYRGGGCSLLQPVLMDQIASFDPTNWDHNHVLFTLFAEEDRLIRQGILGDHYAMFIAA